MDETQNNPKENETDEQSATPTAPLMDVQPPKQQDDEENPAADQAVTPEPSPSITPPIESIPEAGPGDDDSNSIPPFDPSQANHDQSNSQPTADHNVDKPAVASKAVLVVIILALVLAGVSVFLYLQNKSDTPSQTNNTVNQAPQTAAITPQNIDETTQAIDQATSQLDDEKDFPDNELANTTLGL